MTPKDYLKRPYHFVIVRDDDAYMGTVDEFPGCIACADTPEETMSRLMDVAEGWLAAALALGQPIPLPKPDVR